MLLDKKKIFGKLKTQECSKKKSNEKFADKLIKNKNFNGKF